MKEFNIIFGAILNFVEASKHVHHSSHHECPDNIPDSLILLDEPVEIIHQDTVLVRHLL